MKKKQLVTFGVVVAFVAGFIAINTIQPSRISEQRLKEAEEAKKLVDDAHKEKPGDFQDVIKEGIKNISTASKVDATTAEATTPYQVEFQCSNGTFIVEVHPEWSPLGAAQFRAAVEAGVYNEARFFRVLPGFVVQWGVPGDPEQAAIWGKKNIKDEPVKTSNIRGTITFAKSSAPNSRTTQVFINYQANTQLDGMGFSPFGRVAKGMEVVDAINSQYREEPDQGEIESKGNAYLKEYFPKLDYIKSAKVLGDVAAPAVAQGAVTAPPAAVTEN